VRSMFSLNQLGSSVERSAAERRILQRLGGGIRIFNLSGFIFFGSANAFLERIKALYADASPTSSFALFNFTRVIGIDSTGAQTFVKLIAYLNSKEITPVFCGLNRHVDNAFRIAEVSTEGKSLMFETLDFALESLEESLLASQPRQSSTGDIRQILGEFLVDAKKVDRLAAILDRLALKKGDFLFHQGDTETSLYLIESGTIEVRLEEPAGGSIRLREFRGGSILGEMAVVTDVHMRSASALAVEDAVVYRLEPERISKLGEQAMEYRLLLHELIARLLASRLSFMNERTQADV